MTLLDTLRPDQRTDSTDIAGPGRQRTWTLVVSCAGVALVVASMVALNTALDDIATATSASQAQLTWIVDGYTLVLACLLLPAGAIGDRYGRRGALLAGLAIFAVASIAPLVFPSPVHIIVARAVAGAGAALIMPSTLSLLTAAYPAEERTKAVGIWAAVAGSGAVLGMLGSGALLHFWSWQSIFWALGAGAVVLFVLGCTVASSRVTDAPPVDWPGAGLIGAAVAALVFGILQAPRHGWTNPLVYGAITAGVALAVLFGVVELRRRQPLLDVRLFANPAFAAGAATIVVFFAANLGFLYLLMQFLQLIKGYSPIGTAIAISPLMIGIAVLSGLSFWYLPKLGLRLVLFTGLALISVAFYLLGGIDASSTYLDQMWRWLVLSAGIGLLTAPATSAIMTAVPDNKQGVASAVNDAAREIGAALGIAVAGSILAARYTDRLLPQLAGFPAPVRGPASDSLAQALQISGRMGPQGDRLAAVSETAFVHAMHTSVLVIAALVAVTAVLIGLWAPGRDGRQLRVIRRLRSRGA
ncbi:MAG: MFS transporter, partial [Mycobacteriaceae bacterium]|nr:MFS transporter [Mycobacteriaceae bacterium]